MKCYRNYSCTSMKTRSTKCYNGYPILRLRNPTIHPSIFLSIPYSPYMYQYPPPPSTHPHNSYLSILPTYISFLSVSYLTASEIAALSSDGKMLGTSPLFSILFMSSTNVSFLIYNMIQQKIN